MYTSTEDTSTPAWVASASAMAAQLRTAIAEALATQAGVEVSSVDVYIDGLQFKA